MRPYRLVDKYLFKRPRGIISKTAIIFKNMCVNCIDEVCELGMRKTLSVVVLSKLSLNRMYNSCELYIQTL